MSLDLTATDLTATDLSDIGTGVLSVPKIKILYNIHRFGGL
jgi:hypothetical protein